MDFTDDAQPPPDDTDRDTAANAAHRALNILAKWRVLFTGWQLGTRAKGDPEGDAVRDHRETTIMLRAETTAIAGLLLQKGLVSDVEWLDALRHEAEQLNNDYARRFPGVTASETGLTISPHAAASWMKDWKP